MKFAYLLLAPALVASASSHAAEPAAQTPEMDMRCFLTASAAAENLSDPQMKQMAIMSSLFYLGRTSGRLTDAQMETVALQQAETLKTTDLPTLLSQCGTYMGQRAQAVQAIGQRMEAKAKAADAAKK